MIIALSNAGQLVEGLAGVGTLFESFPKGSLWWVSVDELLLGRATVLRSQFARSLTPDLRPAASIDDFERLAALEGLSLTSGIDFSAVHLPPLLAFSPGAAGIVLPAAPHALVLLYGGLEHLRRPWPHAVTALYEPRVLNDPRDLADVDLLQTFAPSNAEGLLTWWVARLNVLYSHGLDPTRFVDPMTAQHDAAAQTAFLLTVERLLTDGILLQGQPQAPNMERLHTAFDLLDKAETLLGYDDFGKGFTALLRRKKAEPRLKEALARIPVVGERFEDRTSRLYEAVYRSMLDNALTFRRTPKGGVRVASKEADQLEAMSPDDYVATLVRAVRNSAHGLLHSLTQGDQRFLLATNSCAIPGELSDLAVMVMFTLVSGAEALCDGTWAQRLRIA